ncbi:MAG: STAS domain-containing protein [Pseudomonadota bacterium]
MRFASEKVGDVVVMSLEERRLDSRTVAEFREAAREAFRDDCGFYVLDLSAVGFMDSAGVGALVGLLKYLGRHRRLELCGLKPTVRKIFRLTRLEKVFTIRDSKEACIAASRSLRSASRARG